MEIAISLLTIGKVLVSACAIGVLALFCLLPINDQPTSKVQVLAWLILSGVAVSLIFGLIKISVSFS